MGGFLDKPKTIKHNDGGEGNKLLFGVSCMQGWRCEMEDAYYACAGLQRGFTDWSFFAVFDGHAGCSVSKHCAANLLDSILGTLDFKIGEYERGIRTGFLELDKSMQWLPELKQNASKGGGTTVVCAFVSPTHVYIANCGDSRALLCRGGLPVFATQDHKPILPVEKERIHNAGGSVLMKRVNGMLAVSRALGDFDFKRDQDKDQCEQMVSPDPEIFCQTRQDTDEFLVLACDGIWDVMSNEDVCSFVHSRLKVTNDLIAIANEVVDTCLNKGSKDNMSIIIVAFPGAPKPSKEAQAEDRRVDKEIEKLVREEIARNNDTYYSTLLQELNSKNIEGLPPGGGLHSKYHIIKRVYTELLPQNLSPEEQYPETASH